jgi:small subunit ribosomal protein S6
VQPVTTYETVFITLPSLTEQEETDLVAALAQVVSDDGGTMVANDRMGRRRLAYPIRKFEDGVYTRFLYDASAAVPKELDRRIRLSDKILRHLTVRLEPDWAVAAKEQAVRDAAARVEAARLAAVAAAEAAEAEARKEAEAAATAAAAEAAGETPETPSEEASTEAPEATTEKTPEESRETSASDPSDERHSDAPEEAAPEEAEEDPAKKGANEVADA